MDALTFLRDRPPASLGAIFTAQVVEHFAFDVLKEFLALCRSRLRQGGLLVAETVNPHSLEAFKTFYTDLSHQRPIFPEVALAFCQLSGFSRLCLGFRWDHATSIPTDSHRVNTQLWRRPAPRTDTPQSIDGACALGGVV